MDAERSCSRAEAGRRILSPGKELACGDWGASESWVDHLNETESSAIMSNRDAATVILVFADLDNFRASHAKP